jgi:hypothetical protein
MGKVSPLAFLGTLILVQAAWSRPSAAQATGAPIDCSKLTATNVDHSKMDHSVHASLLAACNRPLPTMPGQAAFGAIGEIIRLLDADPLTDWTKANIEGLRAHLVDMDDVIMRSSVTQRSIPGGLQMDITGAGKIVGAIQRMAMSHARSLDQSPDYAAAATELPNGARLVITARDSANTARAARIRGLGFAGLMAEGDHHMRHHLALARGDTAPHH